MCFTKDMKEESRISPIPRFSLFSQRLNGLAAQSLNTEIPTKQHHSWKSKISVKSLIPEVISFDSVHQISQILWSKEKAFIPETV